MADAAQPTAVTSTIEVTLKTCDHDGHPIGYGERVYTLVRAVLAGPSGGQGLERIQVSALELDYCADHLPAEERGAIDAAAAIDAAVLEAQKQELRDTLGRLSAPA